MRSARDPDAATSRATGRPIGLRRFRETAWLGPVLATVLLASPAQSDDLDAAVERATSFDECQALVARYPQSLRAYSCFFRIALARSQAAEASRRLEARLALEPGNPRALYYLAQIKTFSSGGAVEEGLLRQALQGFIEEADLEGQVLVRNALAFSYVYNQRHEEAELELGHASEAAEASGRPELVARVRSVQALLATEQERFGRAWVLGKQAEQAVFPDGPRELQVRVLSLLATTALSLGRDELGLEIYQRQAAILKQAGLPRGESTVRYNIAMLAGKVRVPRRFTAEERCGLAREALELAVAAGNTPVEVNSLFLVAQCERGERRTELLERLLAKREDYGNILGFDARHAALCMLAGERLDEDPASFPAALALIDDAIEHGRRDGQRRAVAEGLYQRAKLQARSGRREGAVADGLAALDVLESIRDLQEDGMSRARTFAELTPLYYALAGYLSGGASRTTDELDLALRIVERMRARVLLDELDAAGATARIGGDERGRVQRDELLREISRVQQGMLQGRLSAEERAEALVELERLELQELALRNELARIDPAFAALRRPEIPSIAALQASLAPDEALISFQLDPNEVETRRAWSSEHWVMAISRGSVSTHVLSLARELEGLEQEIDFFLGLLRRRDGSESIASGRLHDLLLADALAALPDGIRRLVIVPDGPLLKLPFGALAADAGAFPLGARYEISLVPSATVWRRWRTTAAQRSADPVLAIADPALAGRDEGEIYREGDPFDDLRELGSLPYARIEANELVRRLGRGSRLLAGGEASEHAVKSAGLDRYRIVHFAAHAVVDERRPARSAILLAAGSENEDGLLQVREIVDLDLSGKIIIVSACRSASGLVLEGEGVMALARAFFQAGARAVIGGLWPLRDDEAARLIGDLSSHLASGQSLGRALREARSSRIRAGRPAASWAGLVLLGDAELVPFPGGASPVRRPWVWIVAAAALLALLWIFFRASAARS